MREKDDLMLKWFNNNYDNSTLGYIYLGNFSAEEQLKQIINNLKPNKIVNLKGILPLKYPEKFDIGSVYWKNKEGKMTIKMLKNE